MKRYFEVVGKNQTLELDVEKGSQAEKATENEISAYLNYEVKELNLSEYKKLKTKFTA